MRQPCHHDLRRPSTIGPRERACGCQVPFMQGPSEVVATGPWVCGLVGLWARGLGNFGFPREDVGFAASALTVQTKYYQRDQRYR